MAVGHIKLELKQEEIDTIVQALFLYGEDLRELDPERANDASRQNAEAVEAIFEKLWPLSTLANI